MSTQEPNTALTVMETNLQAVESSANALMPTLIKLALANMPKDSTEKDAERVVTRELANLTSVLITKPELAVCTMNSKIQALRDCINANLSLAPSANLVYLYPTQVTVGVDGSNQPIKEWVMVFDPTVNGELSMARQAGRIFDHRVSVQYDEAGHVHSVSVTYLIPTVGGSRWSDPMVYMKPHFEKWKRASARKNSKGVPNANYSSWNQDDAGKGGSIDPDFATTKAILHSLKRRGTNLNEVSGPVPSVVVDQKTPYYEAVIKSGALSTGGKGIIYEETTTNVATIPAKSNTAEVNNVIDKFADKLANQFDPSQM